MLLVKADNEGRLLFEIAPREKITQDFESLAARLLGVEAEPAKAGFKLFARTMAVRT